MQERRKQPRKQLMSYTQVFDLYGGKLLGYLGDMNLGGVMTIGDKDVVINTKLTLVIELPELEGVTATRMTIPARVAWCEPDISPQYFNIGFEFQELQAGQEKIISAIMEKYEFRREMPKYNTKPSAGC
jgi:Tfp pilus assembly protein PilZ